MYLSLVLSLCVAKIKSTNKVLSNDEELKLTGKNIRKYRLTKFYTKRFGFCLWR